MIGAIFLLPVILGTTQAFDPFYPFEVATGELKPRLRTWALPGSRDGYGPWWGTGKDATIVYQAAADKLYFNDTRYTFRRLQPLDLPPRSQQAQQG